MSYFVIYGMWDTAATAVLSAVALAIISIWAIAWPKLTKAGVEAETIRRDAAVVAAIQWWKMEAEKCEARCTALEKELRTELHRLEARIQLEASRCGKYRLLWEMATNRTPTMSQEDMPVSTVEPELKPNPPSEPSKKPAP